VLALPPIVRVFTPKSRQPFVEDGFVLCKFKIPLIVKSLVEVIPPIPLIVKLLTDPENSDPGKIMAVLFAKSMLAPAFPASIDPLVLEGALPAIVSVLAPIVSVSEVNESCPFMVILWFPRITPPVLVIVRLFREGVTENRLFGRESDPVPPKLSEDVVETLKKPAVFVRDPLIPNVISPTIKLPLVNVRLLFTAEFAEIVTPLLLLTVRL
jgi:hypothetical protein